MATFLITGKKIQFVDRGSILKKPNAGHKKYLKNLKAFQKDVLLQDNKEGGKK
jgi:hypothetical protein